MFRIILKYSNKGINWKVFVLMMSLYKGILYIPITQIIDNLLHIEIPSNIDCGKRDTIRNLSDNFNYNAYIYSFHYNH